MLQGTGKVSGSEIITPAIVEHKVESPAKMQASPPAPTHPAPLTPTSMPAAKPTKRTAKDYIFGKVIGDGCYSTVFLAKDIHSAKECASKLFYQYIM